MFKPPWCSSRLIPIAEIEFIQPPIRAKAIAGTWMNQKCLAVRGVVMLKMWWIMAEHEGRPLWVIINPPRFSQLRQ